MSEYSLKIKSPGAYGIWKYEAILYSQDGTKVAQQGFDTQWLIRRWARRRARWHRRRSEQTITV